MLEFLSLLFAILPFTSAEIVSEDHNVLFPRQSVARTIQLQPPIQPPPGRQVIDASFQSYSIEFSYMADYAGNFSHPNTFSQKMLQNLGDISGVYPIIRVGGSTQNRATWVQNQTLGVIPKFSSPTADQPSALTIGPAWLESFQLFPKGTRYIYGLSFQDGASGLNQTMLEALPAYKAMGSSLYAFEIGNEVDGFPGGRRPANWTVQDYVNQWLEYAADIDTELNAANSEPLFQAGAFEAPRSVGNLTRFTAESAIHDGIATTGKVKTIADHDYMGSNCASNTVPATLEKNLLNHFRMTSLMRYHDYLANYSVSHGVPYVIGETNSISCQGQANISDVFGAALWSIDYVLYVAALKVSRMYFHMGTPYRYSAWQPIDVNGVPSQPKALYYGNLFTASTLAGGDKQVVILVNETSFTAYGIYSGASKTGNGATLTDIVLVNLNMFNSTQPSAERPYTEVVLPVQSNDSLVTARRLTAPGVETSQNITWAGQYVAIDGSIIGEAVTEKVLNGTVLVGAGEALLVNLGNG